MRCARRWWREAIRTTSRCSRCSSWPPTSCPLSGSPRVASGMSSKAGCCSRAAPAAPESTMRRARAERAALAVLLLILALGGAAEAQKRATPAGTFGGGTLEGRVYRVWLPSRPAAARPLIVALHGCWQTPEDFALGTRLNDAAEAPGPVVIYPAHARPGNPHPC